MSDKSGKYTNYIIQIDRDYIDTLTYFIVHQGAYPGLTFFLFKSNIWRRLRYFAFMNSSIVLSL